MSQRHKRFRKNHGGLTPYMIWILSGYLCGYKITHNEKHKRMYVLVDRHGEIRKYVHASAVNILVTKQLLRLADDKTHFLPTPSGFNIAHDRLKKAKATLVKGPNSHIFACNNPAAVWPDTNMLVETDSSLYAG